MELVAILFLVALADPIRWVISILSAWFVPNHIGAILVSVVLTTGLTLAIVRSPSPGSLVIGAIVSAVITSGFFMLRRKLRNKKLQRQENGPSA